MDFVILGTTALHIDGQSIPLGAAKQRGMLALLLYHAGEPVRVDTIAEHLWGGQNRTARRGSLYSMVSRIRAALGRAGLADTLSRLPGAAAYRLDVDRELVDYHRFRRLVEQGRDAARQHQYDRAVAVLEQATRLWLDEPLADLHAAPADDLRRHMNNGLLAAQKLLAENRLQLGQHHRVLVEIEPLLRANDLDETLAQLWATALSGADREPEARSFVRTFRRRFRQHLRADPTLELPSAVGGLDRVDVDTAKMRREAARSAGVPHQLPRDIGDFVGHAQLLATIDSLTAPGNAATNVVTVSGMPGVGKTTLAVHWAYRHRDRFPDGSLYLNALAYGPTAAVDPEDALGRFLSALDVPSDRMPAGLDRRHSRFNELLTGRRMFILLDNVRDAAQVRSLIPNADECVTLITCRSRLSDLTIRDGVPGVIVVPLTEADGLALLGHTIGDARARAEPEAVGTLARLSAGLPLALRIIGEHIAERPRPTLADLASELASRLFDAGEEDSDAASLRTVFTWSYQTLAPESAQLFRLLGLQPGPTIGPEAAAALLGTDAARTESLLNGLARMHLINHDTARHYRPHDLLRRFAAERANEDDSSATRAAALRRLLDWSVLSGANALAVLVPDRETVPDLPAPVGVTPQTFTTDREAMAWCEQERENLSAASVWAAHHEYDRHAWQLPQVLLEALQRRGHLEEAVPLLQSAISAAERDGHQTAQIGTLNNLGAIYLALHDRPKAVASLEDALRLARHVKDADKETMCRHNLATAHLHNGDAQLAAQLHGTVLAACRAAGNTIGEAAAHHKLGDDLRQLHQHNEAATHYAAALEIREQMHSLRGQGTLHTALAELYLETGEHERASDHAQRALDFYNQARDDPGLCDALIVTADIGRVRGCIDEAIQDAKHATSLSAELADSRRRCRALTTLAEALTTAGEHPSARTVCLQAEAILSEVHDPHLGPVRDRLHAIHQPS